MWATWANLGPRQGQNCAQIGPTSANNNNHHNLGPRQGQTCAQIQQQQQQKTRTTTTTTTTTTTPTPTPKPRTTTTTPARADRSAFAGARLSGVSLINPGAGPGPVSSPEAFGGNRRLYTAAAPAADHLVSIPVHGCPIPVHARSTIIVVIYSAFCVWCSKNVVFYRVLWPSPSPGFILATLKNHEKRKGSGTDNWTS